MQFVKEGDHVLLNDGTEMKVYRVSDSGWISGVTENGPCVGAPISTRKECVTRMACGGVPSLFERIPFCDMSAPEKKSEQKTRSIEKKEVRNPFILIERVIFNPPATIVLWKDGSKTVVKVHNEEFDKEKGLAMAILRSEYGAGIRKLFKKWCADDKDET